MNKYNTLKLGVIMKIDISTVKVKCENCGSTYKIFTVNIKSNGCKICLKGKITKA
jgi:protein-arginine kinase activator protein McsA